MAFEVSRKVVTCPNGALVGDAVYFSAANVVSYADSDDPDKYADCIIVELITATTCIATRKNVVIGGLSGLTAGTKYYLSGTATAGNTISATVGAQLIGTAISTTELQIHIDTGIVWDDLRFPAIIGKLGGASNPTLAAFPAGQNTKAYHFNKAQDNELFFVGQLPHGYKLGTDLHAHIHWSPIDTNTGVCRWVVDHSIIDINGTFEANVTLTVEDAGDGTTNKHQYADLGDISGSGLTGVNAMILLRVYREGTHSNDTYDNDAVLLKFDLHFQLDTRGSNQEAIK